MSYRLVRTVSGALVFFGIATAASATVLSKASIGGQSAPVPISTSAPYQKPHFVPTSAGPVLVQRPIGCAGIGLGSLSFIGGGENNFASGLAAGILSGENNGACDQFTVVGSGTTNVIGGSDGDFSYNAVIAGGLTDGIVGSAASFIGAGWNNLISNPPNGTYYNANLSAIAAGNANTITAPNSFIGSGYANAIGSPSFSVPNSPDSFIGAGYGNNIIADYASIGGGYTNTVTGEYAAISGGSTNTAGASYSLIGSGQSNVINSNGSVGGTLGAAYAAIGGGFGNTVMALVASGAKYGFIGGGHGNALSAFNGVIGGGQSNTATGDDSTVPGGIYNYAEGAASFAAGNGSQALTNGSFVWSDDASPATTLKSTVTNQFLARASGGFYLYSAANLSTGVKLAPGSGSWSSLSDRAAKIAIANVDDSRILAKVASLPVSEWSYSAQGTGVRHLGPMAQDFRAAFGLGEDEKHISAVDEEGVALAAIKALQAEVAEKDRKLDEVDAKYARLEQRLVAVEKTVQAIQ